MDTPAKKEIVNSPSNRENGEALQQSLSNKWGRLAQGNAHKVKGIDTMMLIPKAEVLKNKAITHASFLQLQTFERGGLSHKNCSER